MSAIHDRARISSLRRFEELARRQEPKKPKNRRSSRRPKKGAKKNANGK